MKKYLIVVNSNKKVLVVFESEIVDEKNSRAISQRLIRHFQEESQRYPEPKYDVIIGTGVDIHSIKQGIGTASGWETIKVEPLPA